MLMFLISFLILYFGACFYVWFRLRPVFSAADTGSGIITIAVYALICISFFIGMLLLSKDKIFVATPFYTIGCMFMAVLLYLFLCFFVIDIARVINLIFKFDWLSFRYSISDAKAPFFSYMAGIISILIVAFGYFNARYPVTKIIEYQTEKKIDTPVRFIAVSDIHIGLINNEQFLADLVEKINVIKPDFVIIAGDFFDGNTSPVINSQCDIILKRIITNYGVYAVTGNHEYIGDAATACKWLTNSGLTVLKDSVVNLPCGVSLIGREDLSARKQVDFKSLTMSAPKENYKIVIDHQPSRTDESVFAKVDLHISGHTHAGQLFPINLLTGKIYENDFGQSQKGSTYIYCTSGYGTWGPPVRTTAHPEMVYFEIHK